MTKASLVARIAVCSKTKPNSTTTWSLESKEICRAKTLINKVICPSLREIQPAFQREKTQKGCQQNWGLGEEIRNTSYLWQSVVLSLFRIEAAHRLLRYADNCNFFKKGKKIELYAAAALYITLRFQKAPYLLIDFSDKMGIKMFPLARCFLKMSKKFGFQQ